MAINTKNFEKQKKRIRSLVNSMKMFVASQNFYRKAFDNLIIKFLQVTYINKINYCQFQIKRKN